MRGLNKNNGAGENVDIIIYPQVMSLKLYIVLSQQDSRKEVIC